MNKIAIFEGFLHKSQTFKNMKIQTNWILKLKKIQKWKLEIVKNMHYSFSLKTHHTSKTQPEADDFSQTQISWSPKRFQSCKPAKPKPEVKGQTRNPTNFIPYCLLLIKSLILTLPVSVKYFLGPAYCSSSCHLMRTYEMKLLENKSLAANTSQRHMVWTWLCFVSCTSLKSWSFLLLSRFLTPDAAKI